MITFKQKGSTAKTEGMLHGLQDDNRFAVLDQYAQRGVAALSNATPRDSGLTADSWGYFISRTKKGYTITWTNSNTAAGMPIPILLQYGHGTGNGGWVEGIDFINPPMEQIFGSAIRSLWKEVTSK
jgi:hypothetical protein